MILWDRLVLFDFFYRLTWSFRCSIIFHIILFFHCLILYKLRTNSFKLFFRFCRMIFMSNRRCNYLLLNYIKLFFRMRLNIFRFLIILNFNLNIWLFIFMLIICQISILNLRIFKRYVLIIWSSQNVINRNKFQLFIFT